MYVFPPQFPLRGNLTKLDKAGLSSTAWRVREAFSWCKDYSSSYLKDSENKLDRNQYFAIIQSVTVLQS